MVFCILVFRRIVIFVFLEQVFLVQGFLPVQLSHSLLGLVALLEFHREELLHLHSNQEFLLELMTVSMLLHDRESQQGPLRQTFHDRLSSSD